MTKDNTCPACIDGIARTRNGLPYQCRFCAGTGRRDVCEGADLTPTEPEPLAGYGEPCDDRR